MNYVVQLLKGAPLTVIILILSLIIFDWFGIINAQRLVKFGPGGLEFAKAEAGKAIPDRLLQEGKIYGQDALNKPLKVRVLMSEPQRVIVIKRAVWSKLNENRRLKGGLIVATSIYQSILSGTFETLVIVDENDKPVGNWERSYFLDLMRLPLDRLGVEREDENRLLSRSEIRARIQTTNLWSILKNPTQASGNKAFENYTTSKIELFRKMMREQYEVLVLTAPNGKYIGVVSKQSLGDVLIGDIFSKEEG